MTPEQTKRVIAMLRELSDDLAAEVDARYIHDGRVHPANKWRYERDMEPVVRARALIAELETQE